MKIIRKLFSICMMFLLLISCKDSSNSLDSLEKKEIVLTYKINQNDMMTALNKVKDAYNEFLSNYSSVDFEMIDRIESIDEITLTYPKGVVTEGKSLNVSTKVVQYDKNKKLIKSSYVSDSKKQIESQKSETHINIEDLYKIEETETYYFDLVNKFCNKSGKIFDDILKETAHYLGYILGFDPNNPTSNYEYYYDNDILSIVSLRESDLFKRKTIYQMIAKNKSIELIIITYETTTENSISYKEEINSYKYQSRLIKIKNVNIQDVSKSDFAMKQ